MREKTLKTHPKKAWPSDRELVDQILAGSREHFDLLYEAYFPRVYRFALKRLSDPGEAEDVPQCPSPEAACTEAMTCVSSRPRISCMVK